MMKTRTRIEETEVRGPRTRMNTDMLTTAAQALAQAIEVLNELEVAADSESLDLRRGVDFYQEVTCFEIKLIKRALVLAGGRQTRAAALLRLRTTTLNAKIKQYKIDWQWAPCAEIQTGSDDLSN